MHRASNDVQMQVEEESQEQAQESIEVEESIEAEESIQEADRSIQNIDSSVQEVDNSMQIADNSIQEVDKSFEESQEQVNDRRLSFAPIDLEPSARKRKMSFDISKQAPLELMFNQSIHQNYIFGEQDTYRTGGVLPNFSNANDDIDVGRKRDKTNIMGFLYAGDIPEKHSSKNKKRSTFVEMA